MIVINISYGKEPLRYFWINDWFATVPARTPIHTSGPIGLYFHDRTIDVGDQRSAVIDNRHSPVSVRPELDGEDENFDDGPAAVEFLNGLERKPLKMLLFD